MFDGADVTHAPVQGRDMAMVFQTFALYPHLTAFENLAYPLRVAGLDRWAVSNRVGEVADMLGLNHILARKPKTASGGEQQRLAIGRALVRRPRLLLLDEPLTNLDAKLRHDMRAEFKRLHRELGMTVLYATPDQLEALSMGERIAVLLDGRIAQIGTPDELYVRPKDTAVAAMVGAPKVNLVPAVRRGSDRKPTVELPFGAVSQGPWAEALKGFPVGTELIFGCRPHDVVPAAAGAGATPFLANLRLERTARRRGGARPRSARRTLENGSAGRTSHSLPARRFAVGGDSNREHPGVRSGNRYGDPLGRPIERGGAMRPRTVRPKEKEGVSMFGKLRLRGVLAAGLVGAGLAAAAPSYAAEDIVLTMAAPDWGPTRFLQEKANSSYRAKSGNNVSVVVDFIPWPSFYERVAASLTSGEQKYQMVVTDSQWLGQFVEGGYFLKLNEHIDADPELQGIMKDVHPAMVDAYSTYPHKSPNYYGFPADAGHQGDVVPRGSVLP